MFDIRKRAARHTAKLELLNGDEFPLLDDDGNQLYVTVYGPALKQWRQADAERQRRRNLRAAKRGNVVAAMLDEPEDDETDFLVSVTVSFDGWSYPAPEGGWGSDRDMFRAAYTDHEIGFIRDFVKGEVGKWAVFTKGSATN